ncbi:hypothetical protein STAS_26486 [Striga asiatica]|uniref:KIB1-4 beta-propeller domain-containing protein n=1 Tax=Striga asiatica TaxID=4170 RepID=A0A5A7QW99_STRAF|nr:hypothetical protein STAS_26486 [Striga asiatica]
MIVHLINLSFTMSGVSVGQIICRWSIGSGWAGLGGGDSACWWWIDVHRYDPEEEEGGFKRSGLGAWALFVGFQSNAFALPVANFSGLKSNSIYFTDNSTQVVHIFDYEDKTVSPSCYPSNVEDLERIVKQGSI